jgi:hypothetical protein
MEQTWRFRVLAGTLADVTARLAFVRTRAPWLQFKSPLRAAPVRLSSSFFPEDPMSPATAVWPELPYPSWRETAMTL